MVLLFVHANAWVEDIKAIIYNRLIRKAIYETFWRYSFQNDCLTLMRYSMKFVSSHVQRANYCGLDAGISVVFQQCYYLLREFSIFINVTEMTES